MTKKQLDQLLVMDSKPLEVFIPKNDRIHKGPPPQPPPHTPSHFHADLTLAVEALGGRVAQDHKKVLVIVSDDQNVPPAAGSTAVVSSKWLVDLVRCALFVHFACYASPVAPPQDRHIRAF